MPFNEIENLKQLYSMNNFQLESRKNCRTKRNK